MVELWWHPVSPPSRAVELAAKYAGVDVDRKYLDLFNNVMKKLKKNKSLFHGGIPTILNIFHFK